MALQPFEKFAYYYDGFMKDLVDYERWVGYTIEIWRREKIAPKRILDLACGTGIPTLLLLKMGYEVIGIDRSPEMLAVLERKAKREEHARRLKIIQTDIRNFQIQEKVCACVSYYDSINYLIDEEDLKSCFHSVFSVLKEGGIFTFDMNTIFSLENLWDNHSLWRESSELLTLWRNEYDKEKKISKLYLKCWVKGPGGKPLYEFEELHQERGYELKEVTRYLQEAGFSEVKFYHHLTFEPPYPETPRVMAIARRGF